MVMVFGEITTTAKVDYEAVVRQVCKDIGFNSEEDGLNGNTCEVLVRLHEQSPVAGQGVRGMGTKALEDIGAGDQGIMFGYATDEHESLMPLTLVLAHRLGHRLTVVRKGRSTCPSVLPDGKTQVTIEYKNDNGAMVPLRVHTVLISTQHKEGVTNEKIAEDLMNEVIKKVIPEKYLDDKTIYHLNPSGRFVIGGPDGDAGLTGEKIIIDTYGGWGAHGGGAFSGKDPTKVDRSGAYIARQAAKSVEVAARLRRCLMQISYAIGVAKPLSVHIDTYGTGKTSDAEILKKVEAAFDFRPGMIGKNLDLKKADNKRYQTAMRSLAEATTSTSSPGKRSLNSENNYIGEGERERERSLETHKTTNICEKNRACSRTFYIDNTTNNLPSFVCSFLPRLLFPWGR